MAEQKLSQRTETTSATGGYLHIIRDIGAGMQSFKISFANLFASTNSAISGIQTSIAPRLKVEKKTSISANTTFAMPNNSKLESIDLYWIGATPTISAGTSSGATDIVAPIALTSGAESVTCVKLYPTTATLYINVAGGTVNININYREGQ